ncbi:hypothetical protein Taro_039417 [Colocasia esculenta]|uniref:Uncharacterized protein n=1 Tax=Colocasia esculenta TaxID=4460 RepID=A0A843W9A4_COLES|nr:hypothetical protein [Colocasia esculenta]
MGLQWYNQLVGHVGIHGQRRFTEALEKRSLVYRFGMTGRELPNPQERLPRRIPVRVATGRELNATLGCEERDGVVRSGSKVATERFVTFRTGWGMLSRQDHRTRPIGPSRSQGLRLNLAEKVHVLGLRSRIALY